MIDFSNGKFKNAETPAAENTSPTFELPKRLVISVLTIVVAPSLLQEQIAASGLDKSAVH
jgi:hypothetical protein